MKPTVSVILSVYNARPYLAECIESVLRQSYDDFEFLIVDDGSTDQSWDIIQQYADTRIRAFKIQNSGVARAKNFLLEKATGKWIAIIDADDVWHPLKLEIQMKFLEKNPTYVLVGSFAQLIDKDGHNLHIEPKVTDWLTISKFISEKNMFTHSSVVYSREAAVKIGGYNTSVHQYLTDYALMKALCNTGKATNLPTALVHYRIVPQSVTSGYLPNSRKASDEVKLANYHYSLARIYFLYMQNREKFLHHIARSIALHPSQMKAYKLLIAGLTPGVGQITRRKVLKKEHFEYIHLYVEPGQYLERIL